METAYSALGSAKDKMRRALREMLLCAGLVAVGFLIAGALSPSIRLAGEGDGMVIAILDCAIEGLWFCLPVWIIYRIARFVLTR